MAIVSIPGRLFKQAEMNGHKPAYYEKTNGAWQPSTWRHYGDQVAMAARAMITLGFNAKDTVCILGFNRPEWVIFDLAAIAAGGAPAGIYTTCSPDEVQYIINHSEAKLVLLEDTSQWEKVLAELKRLPKLEKVVMMRGADPIDHDLVLSWEDFMAKGEETDRSAVDARLEGITEDQVATFIYTSGTTGPPKAVMLSHKNLSWTARIAVDLAEASSNDSSISYLPLSHIAEQMFTIHAPITVGWPVYYAESIEALPDNLKEVQPTIVFGVPRIWEKMHAKVSDKMSQATGLKAKLLAFAQRTGERVTHLKNHGKAPTGLLKVKYAIANRLIFSKVKPAMGLSNARTCVTGAAPISPEVLKFFASIDICIREVYGQSEDTGPTTFNLAGHTRFGTVGCVLDGTEVKIADDGEILVRGPHVFLGYYKDQAATDDTLINGWLHSGDLGEFTQEGFLKITGRKKEIIITAGGKNIAPKNIEAAIKNCSLVAQSVVIGDRRKFLSALVTLEPDAIAAWAADKGVSADKCHDNPEMIATIQAWIDEKVNPLFARVEHVRKFTLLPQDFSIDKGELTPTLKIKRRIIYDNYAKEIDGMYRG
jgi:long-chain acyl-CoA synthetase